MRFLHTSDWHLGRRLVRTDLIDYQAEFLRWLLDLAVEREVDAVVVAGDIYDRAQPSAEAVDLLDRTVDAFAAAEVPLVLISGNHDSAVRLRYGGRLFQSSGVHVRAELGRAHEPVVLHDDDGQVGVYGIPYLVPDAVREELEAERSHESVLAAVCGRIARDAQQRGLQRTVVVSHCFLTGGSPSESERTVTVGGVGDAPSGVFDGFSYVALGHLHRPQDIEVPGSATRARYSGSPLAFSFSERDHPKSVTLVDLTSDGVSTQTVPVPVGRPLRQITGELDELLALDDEEHAGAWLKVVLTDRSRPMDPMARLRAKWPGTLILEFAPDARPGEEPDGPRPFGAATPPEEIITAFVEHVTGSPPPAAQERIIDEVVESVTARAEAGA